MTNDPITVHENDLAAEVVRILREHRIDDLVVINNAGEGIGLVDAQDLSRHGLS